MLVQEWQMCGACGGSGTQTDYCPHCMQPIPTFKTCLACQGKGGRLAIVERPDLTAVPSRIYPTILPAVDSWHPLCLDWRPMYPASPWPTPGSGG
jgi:hypothetical protein